MTDRLTEIKARLAKARDRAIRSVAGQAHYKGHLWITNAIQSEPPYLVSLQRWQWGIEHTEAVPLEEIAESMSNKEQVEMILGRDDIAWLIAELEKERDEKELAADAANKSFDWFYSTNSSMDTEREQAMCDALFKWKQKEARP